MGDKVNESSDKAAQQINQNAGFLNVDWGNKGGRLWECWKLSPCCGEPCNIGDGIYCCATWWLCGLCNASQLCASSVDQDCALVNHCLPVWCCGWFALLAMRHNLRVKAGVGSDTIMEWVGDGLTTYCCGSCAMCQQLRSVEKKDWDFVGKFLKEKKMPQVMLPLKMTR